MRSSRRLWYVLGSTSLVLTILFVVGFANAVWSVVKPSPTNVTRNETSPTEYGEAVSDGKFQIVALGDSLTKGTGDVEGEGGYVGRLKTYIDEQIDEPVHVINFAVDGYHTDQLLNDVQNNSGDQAAVRQADLIVMTIGGNDLFPLEEAYETGIRLDHVEDAMGQALEKLSRIHAELRALNTSAPIYYMGLYNPFGEIEDLAQEVSNHVHTWNYKVQELLSHDKLALLVPTYDLFAYDISNYLSSDSYHPNGSGYDRIAKRIMQLLTARFGWEEGA